MTNDLGYARNGRLIAGLMSFALLVSAAGFIYVTKGTRPQQGFTSAAIDTAALLILIAETDIPKMIRECAVVRRQVLIWGMWLMILGVAPALSPQVIYPVVTAVITGLFISIASITALFVPDTE
jgi:hypothetical protein